MDFWKRINFIFLINIFLIHSAFADTDKICLTGRVAESLPNYGASFVNGALLAKSEEKEISNLPIKTFFYDKQPLSIYDAYNKVQNSSCVAIIGYEYLTDLLLISKYQKNTHLPILSPYTSTLQKQILPLNIFIFSPSYDFLAKKMIGFLNKKYKKLGNILLVTAINRNEMLDYKEAYSNILKKEHIPFDTFDLIEGDSIFTDKLNDLLKNKKYQYIFLLLTATDSAKVINSVSNKKSVFIGTEYWGSTSMESLYMLLKKKDITAFFIRNLDFIKKEKKLSAFKKRYLDAYHQTPTIMSAYIYDATKLILKIKRAQKKVSPENIKNTNYDGITGISVHNGHFYRSDDYVILSVTNSGYQNAQ